MSVDQRGSKTKNILKWPHNTGKEKAFLIPYFFLFFYFFKSFSWFHQTVQEKKLYKALKKTKKQTRLTAWSCVALNPKGCLSLLSRRRVCVCAAASPWGVPPTPWLSATALCCQCAWSAVHRSEDKMNIKKKITEFSERKIIAMAYVRKRPTNAADQQL